MTNGRVQQRRFARRLLDWVVSQPVIHNIKDLFG